MKLKNFLFILLILSLSACKSEPTQFSNVIIDVRFNDTPVTFVAYTDNETEFNNYQDLLRTELTYLGKLFDKYNDYEGINNLKTINDNAGIQAVEVDQTLIDLITFAKEYYSITQNTFDISMGSVLLKSGITIEMMEKYLMQEILLNLEKVQVLKN